MKTPVFYHEPAPGALYSTDSTSVHRATACVASRGRLCFLTMAQADCPNCGGTGWKIVEGDRVIPLAEQRVPEPLAKQAEADKAHAFVLDNFPTVKSGQGAPRTAVPCDCLVGDLRSRIF